MNRFLKKAAAVLTASVLAASAMGMTAFADAAKVISSSEAVVAFEASVAKPTYSVKGTKGERRIKLSTSTSGATIYYTTNGKTPTTSSKKLTSGSLIKITKKTQIKAIAVKGSSKSAVMTKTFSVATLPGDVTGDGNINSTDYTRLKNYLNGDTTYICTDNADVSGNGAVAKKDLTLLNQYLTGQITKFPAAGGTTSSKVTAPTVTVYKTYGGKNVELKCSDSSAKIYYTTNGKTPTNSSTLYKSKFLVDDDTTVKYVSYKNGNYSAVKTKEIEVPQCKSVSSDQPTNKEYDKAITVKLSCPTDSSTKIYYTLDGSNPTTSYTTSLYRTSGISLSKNTTVKAYARAKGYSDSNVSTFDYKIKAEEYFTISGSVWDDTPTETTSADGKRTTGDSGLNGISVSLICVDDSNKVVATTTTTTINGVTGSYSFANAIKGKRYKVSFQFNGMKYRAYDYIVSGGNQAVTDAISSSDILTIDKSGAKIASGTNIAVGVNSYAKAITTDAFRKTATTNYSYNTETKDVNCALVSNIYGKMKLTLTPTMVGNVQYSSSATANPGNSVRYELTLANNSPTAALSSAGIRLYFPTAFDRNSVIVNGYSVSSTSQNSSYYIYDITNAFNQNIAKGTSQKISVQANVGDSAKTGETLTVYAEVINYKYANSAYDYSSVPENLAIPTVRENDEASASIKVSGSTKVLTSDFSSNTTFTKGETKELRVYIRNGDRYNPESDVDVTLSTNSIFTYYTTSSFSGDTATIVYHFTANDVTPAGVRIPFTVKLRENPTQSFTTYLTSTTPPVTISVDRSNVTVSSNGVITVGVQVNNPTDPQNAIRISNDASTFIASVGSPTSLTSNAYKYFITITGIMAGDPNYIFVTSVDDPSVSQMIRVEVT